MSDPRYTDPPPTDPRRPEDRRIDPAPSNNAMWGWIAGGVVLALLLVFIFASGPGTDTADTGAPPATTTDMVPPPSPGPAETTGQGNKPAAPPNVAPTEPAPADPSQSPGGSPGGNPSGQQ